MSGLVALLGYDGVSGQWRGKQVSYKYTSDHFQIDTAGSKVISVSHATQVDWVGENYTNSRTCMFYLKY